MAKRVSIAFGITVAGSVVIGSAMAAPAAHAAVDWSQPSEATIFRVNQHAALSRAQVDAAIREAEVQGAISQDWTAPDGSRAVTIDAGDGHTLQLVSESRDARLWAGSDTYGYYVAFNATDQQLILAGAGAALTAGICVLGPAVCVVATTVIVIAVVAINQNGGIQCGSKAMRVYPFSGHKPRCA